MSSYAAFIVASVSLIAGCGGPPTSLVVKLTSDLAVPEALSGVAVEVGDTWPRIEATDFVLGAPSDLPLSFGVAPNDGDASRIVTVTVRGFHLESSASPIVERQAVLGFVEGTRRLLHLPLLTVCRGVTCVDGDTCIQQECEQPPCEAGCATAGLDARSLPEVTTPGDELDCPD